MPCYPDVKRWLLGSLAVVLIVARASPIEIPDETWLAIKNEIALLKSINEKLRSELEQSKTLQAELATLPEQSRQQASALSALQSSLQTTASELRTSSTQATLHYNDLKTSYEAQSRELENERFWRWVERIVLGVAMGYLVMK